MKHKLFKVDLIILGGGNMVKWKWDPDSGVNPGTKFEDISDDWVCPLCGASKDMFEKIED